MDNLQLLGGIAIFAVTVILLMWRPRQLNEAVPAGVGGLLFLALGIVNADDLLSVFQVVSGASVTILSTIVMSIVLDSIGVFRWTAFNIVRISNGSGIRLFWCLNLLCLVMTLFFNNDGSILITTPVIVRIVQLLHLKPHQSIPYLLSGALVATASSAPIGVSNLANLIALNIVGLDLLTYAKFMFVPSMLGITVMTLLLFWKFKRDIPRKIAVPAASNAAPVLEEQEPSSLPLNAVKHWFGRKDSSRVSYHPLMNAEEHFPQLAWNRFVIAISIVVLTRIGLFAASDIGIPLEAVGLTGAGMLIAARWIWLRQSPQDLIRKTPWSILVFAFGIYVVVYGLHNMGLTSLLIAGIEPFVQFGLLHAIGLFGLMLTVMSNFLNNLPSVMIGTLALTTFSLDNHTMQAAYLANILGSDIGSLIAPFGTLASLLWFHQLRRYRIPFSWGAYLRVTIWVVPITLAASLIGLYLWIMWLV
ncbi:ArsB/NhaD family transporter [Cohnella lubricantis]|uniref:Arsenic transporter n=1 Tax=Cohnella lubricantis TaxID=2163172 RepID=A0A841TKQ8_9BACL|nr:ArsB/NhaD family transporter [Cohnella lubricantis]MBB6679101.1 arsenic transporter [Cohnella lubricantis]MBP2119657.1 arsenical pump membrane protein [Cohnella lubricantis]